MKTTPARTAGKKSAMRPMAVTGGMGRFSGVGGQLRDEIIGSNNTGCPNLRIRILLKRPITR